LLVAMKVPGSGRNDRIAVDVWHGAPEI
jgi:hypothetical protein